MVFLEELILEVQEKDKKAQKVSSSEIITVQKLSPKLASKLFPTLTPQIIHKTDSEDVHKIVHDKLFHKILFVFLFTGNKVLVFLEELILAVQKVGQKA